MRVPPRIVAAAGSLAMQALGSAVVARLPPPPPRPSGMLCDCPLPVLVRGSGLVVLPRGDGLAFLPRDPRASRCETGSPAEDQAPLPLLAPDPRQLPLGEAVVCADIDARGQVRRVWLIHGSGEAEADREAMSTLRATPFQPARLHGRAVTARHVVILGPANFRGVAY
jgi:TonB family protein